VALVKMTTSICWADSELLGVQLDYDTVVVTVRDSGLEKRVRAEGYIGFEYNGAWDELVIDHAEVVLEDAFAVAAWRSIEERYSGSPPLTGSPARNSAAGWQTLTLTFSDGSVMRCACAAIVEEEPDPESP
jgi:hypothetical protein